MNISKEEKVKWILENCINECGDIDLSGLDFSNFDGNVNISKMKVNGSLFQYDQNVKYFLKQNFQTMGCDLYQDHQQVGGHLWQDNQIVGKELYQNNQKIRGKFFKGESK